MFSLQNATLPSGGSEAHRRGGLQVSSLQQHVNVSLFGNSRLSLRESSEFCGAKLWRAMLLSRSERQLSFGRWRAAPCPLPRQSFRHPFDTTGITNHRPTSTARKLLYPNKVSITHRRQQPIVLHRNYFFSRTFTCYLLQTEPLPPG